MTADPHELDEALLYQVTRCPNDGGELEARISHGSGLLHCKRCSRLFPVDDGIPILLPDSKRNPQREIALLQKLGASYANRDWSRHLAETLSLIKQVDPTTVWEWQDVEFWDREYERQIASRITSDWRYRLQQRNRAVNIGFRGLAGAPVILDVGAGEGQTTAELVPQAFSESTYIALDMSFSGLRLNRLRHSPRRGLYLLASADHPPLADALVDIATFYGVLHHSQQKAAVLRSYLRILKENGRIVLAEAVLRPRATPMLLRRWVRHDEESAHEERIPLSAFRQAVGECGRVLYYRQFYTALYGVCSRFAPLRKLLLCSPQTHAAAMAVDDLLSRTLGRLLPTFRPGEVLAVVRKESPLAVAR